VQRTAAGYSPCTPEANFGSKVNGFLLHTSVEKKNLRKRYWTLQKVISPQIAQIRGDFFTDSIFIHE
jgi:hypothetical protein